MLLWEKINGIESKQGNILFTNFHTNRFLYCYTLHTAILKLCKVYKAWYLQTMSAVIKHHYALVFPNRATFIANVKICPSVYHELVTFTNFSSFTFNKVLSSYIKVLLFILNEKLSLQEFNLYRTDIKISETFVNSHLI